MEAVVDVAPTGRSRCRGCGLPIEKGARRVGDVFPSPFADDRLTTHWYHPLCCAYKRPEVMLAALAAAGADPLAQRAGLEQAAQAGLAHRRLSRIDGVERAPSARATCRACRQKIAKDSWRIKLVYFDAGRFEPSGTVHVACARAYFETGDLLPRLQHFSKALGARELAEIGAILAG